jgi:hypothetical protein
VLQKLLKHSNVLRKKGVQQRSQVFFPAQIMAVIADTNHCDILHAICRYFLKLGSTSADRKEIAASADEQNEATHTLAPLTRSEVLKTIGLLNFMSGDGFIQ